MAKVLWPQTHFHLRKGFKRAIQRVANMTETGESLEFACVLFSAESLQDAPGVPADVNVEELSRCVQGVVLQKKSVFRSGPHFPHGFPQWDGPDFCVGKGPARDLVDLICQHFGLTSPDMQVKKKPGLR